MKIKHALLVLGLLGTTLSSHLAQAQPYVYVANYWSGFVSVINAATNTVEAMVQVGPNPDGIAATLDGTRVYVATGNNRACAISIIDTSTNTVVNTLRAGRGCEGAMVVSPDGSRIYVGGVALDTATETVVTTDMAIVGEQIAITPDGRLAFSANGQRVYVTEIETNTVIGAIGSDSHGVAITPDGTRAVTTDSYFSTISVFDTQTLELLASTEPGSGFFPNTVTIHPDGTRAYIADIGTIQIKNPVTLSGMGQINTGIGSALYPALTEDGARLYAPDWSGGSVLVIDTATNQVVVRITEGMEPGMRRAAVTPGQIQ